MHRSPPIVILQIGQNDAAHVDSRRNLRRPDPGNWDKTSLFHHLWSTTQRFVTRVCRLPGAEVFVLPSFECPLRVQHRKTYSMGSKYVMEWLTDGSSGCITPVDMSSSDKSWLEEANFIDEVHLDNEGRQRYAMAIVRAVLDRRMEGQVPRGAAQLLCGRHAAFEVSAGRGVRGRALCCRSRGVDHVHAI